MDSNFSNNALPPLPQYKLAPLPPLLSPIPDAYLVLLLPVVAYWLISLIFHLMDEWDIFPQYRLHTPAEVLKRNHVSRWDVIRDVVIQQIVQTIFGICISWTEPEQLMGKDNYNVAVWAQRIRLFQQGIPSALAVVGIDAPSIAKNLITTHPNIAAVLSGGDYSWLTTMTQQGPVAAFAGWEMLAAKAIYWYGIPALQFLCGIIYVDTWQYFLHRAMHMNKYLYTTFHSRHHRLYVPYAYGALYNHPAEGFALDILGTGMAYMITGMTPRQAMWFYTCSTIKTVDDHCGYALPWDPLQFITSNNAGYHDIHHQSWGIKSNFSQPFSTFWDRILGTVWIGGDVSERYERSRVAAEKKMAADVSASAPNHAEGKLEKDQKAINNTGTFSSLSSTTRSTTRSTKRSSLSNGSTSSASTGSGIVKGLLRDRVSSNASSTTRSEGKGCTSHGLSVGYDGGR